MRRNIGRLAVLAFALTGLACSSSSGGSGPGAADDGGSDATHMSDARVDAKKDAAKAKDAGTDASDASCTPSGTCNACLDTDPDNCGFCGVSCGAGGSCSKGKCITVLASGQGSAPNVVNDLIIDDTNVYWIPAASGSSDGTVLSVPKMGGTLSTVASGVQHPEGLTEDASNLYFISHNVGIEEVPKTGGPTSQLLGDGTLDAGVFPEFWLLLADTDLFYVGGPSTGVYDLQLASLGADGGGVPIPILTSGGLLGAPGTGYNALAVDDGGVYYDTSAQIIALDRATLTVRNTVPGSSATGGDNFGPTITIDQGFIYYIANTPTSTGTESALMKIAKTGGTPTLLTKSMVSFDDGPIFVGTNSIYWTHLTDAASSTASVVAISKSGGVVQTVATGCYANCPFAVDETSVYWPGADGKIRSGPIFL